MKRSLWSLPLVALAALIPGMVSTPVAAGPTGDLWEVTSQMTMEGMPPGMTMPSQTRQVCTAKEWTKPPVAQDDHSCETIDFKGSPTKSSWKMKCDGMSGEGEITRTSPDAFTGWIKMMAPQGTMTMNLTGRKAGDCDAGEAKKQREAQIAHIEAQAAAGEKMVADSMHQACMAPVDALDLRALQGQAQMGACGDPSYKAAFCEKAKTYDGFKLLCKRERSDPESGLPVAAQYCGTDEATMTKVACPQALKLDDLDILGRCCIAEATAVAAEHCAGRSYTSMSGDKYQGFCATFAKDVMEGGKDAPPAPAKKRTGKSDR
jgi:hypothetical protein